jgi:hypothetical protein
MSSDHHAPADHTSSDHHSSSGHDARPDHDTWPDDARPGHDDHDARPDDARPDHDARLYDPGPDDDPCPDDYADAHVAAVENSLVTGGTAAPAGSDHVAGGQFTVSVVMLEQERLRRYPR